MASALQHRGPDDFGFHLAPDVGLGHRRLSIIDLAAGHQPISNEDETLWIVFNGEIYNYEKLRQDLLARGHKFRTHSDTEVLVHLYEEHGEDCVRLLRGMFAFAIWDARRRRLFAARDHLGQKPFFYAERNGEFLFASEIKALLAAAPDLAALNREALDQYFTLRIVPAPNTLFKSIRKLPPAHSLSFEPGGAVRIRRYWDVNFGPKWSGSDDELLEELERRSVEALRFHMVSDVPVGAFLSGGLDSTLVVALLSKHVLSEPLHTFAGSLPYADYDEAPYARLVAERYGTRHVEETIQPSLTQHLCRLLWHLDEPSDALCVCVDRIAAIARRHVKVVLGGDGGDELFAGYDRYLGFAWADQYARIPGPLRRGVLAPLIRSWPQGRWYKSIGHRLRWIQHLADFEAGARYAASLGYFYFQRPERKLLYGPELVQLAHAGEPEAPVRAAFEAAQAEEDLDRMVYADWQTRLPEHSVMILDRMTMAHGLEARSPFLDHELVEFAARLPSRVKIRGRRLRWIEKRLAERYLPAALLRRPKQGFSSALPYMLRAEYKHLSDVLLAKSQLAEAGFLQQDHIRMLVDEHERGAADHANRLWLLINAELWYRMQIEKMDLETLAAQLERRP